jgi:ATP-dependent DNA helicase PIF1
VIYERIDEIRQLKYGFVTGAAGRGKTAVIKEILKQDLFWGRLCATTGVAAINLGKNTPTVFALLQCANVHEFRKAFESGDLASRIGLLKYKGYKRIVIDECSMLLAEIFSYIYRSCKQADMGLILVGDFAQLPPVVRPEDSAQIPKPHWAFLSMYWPEFTNGKGINDGSGIIRLEKNHRQTSPDFNQLLDLLRIGDGAEASKLVHAAGCGWDYALDDNFSGVTLMGRNDIRDLMNMTKFYALPGMVTTYKKTWFGQQTKEWSDIPLSVSLKIGSHAMILRNQYANGRLVQANGTLGTISQTTEEYVTLDTPTGLAVVKRYTEDDSFWVDYEDPRTGETKYRKIEATAGVNYLPVSLAWALTTHKAQGLTLSNVQINLEDSSFRRPALLYVAASRTKDPNQLRFSGSGSFHDLCVADPAVAAWL